MHNATCVHVHVYIVLMFHGRLNPTVVVTLVVQYMYSQFMLIM